MLYLLDTKVSTSESERACITVALCFKPFLQFLGTAASEDKPLPAPLEVSPRPIFFQTPIARDFPPNMHAHSEEILYKKELLTGALMPRPSMHLSIPLSSIA